MKKLRDAVSSIKKLSNFFQKKSNSIQNLLTTFSDGKAYFRNYSSFDLAVEGYRQNCIAHRCVDIISNQATSLKYELYSIGSDGKKLRELKSHPLLNLLKSPFPKTYESDFILNVISNYLIFGNAFIWMRYPTPDENRIAQINKPPIFLQPLLSGYMRYQENNRNPFLPISYIYQQNSFCQQFDVSMLGDSNLIHLKKFNPVSDIWGLSPLVSAGYAIDHHNAAGEHNYQLLNNGARPSGVLIAPAGAIISESEEKRIKSELEEFYCNQRNTGRPMCLTGGWEYKQLSQNLVDIDFNEGKKSAASEIALSYGVPRELINSEPAKYDNLSAAYEQLWNDAVIPVLTKFFSCLNSEVVPRFGKNLYLDYNIEHVPAIISKRNRQREVINKLTYLTDNEKRAEDGYEKHVGDNADILRGSNPMKIEFPTQKMSQYVVKKMESGMLYEEAIRMAKNVFY